MRRNDRAAGDAQYLTGLLYPHKHLQERFYSILPFLAAHGPDLVERLYDALQLDCPDHRVVSISAATAWIKDFKMWGRMASCAPVGSGACRCFDGTSGFINHASCTMKNKEASRSQH